jgi:hypothetical protein
MANTPTLVKTPYVKTKFKDETELNDFIKCCAIEEPLFGRDAFNGNVGIFVVSPVT